MQVLQGMDCRWQMQTALLTCSKYKMFVLSYHWREWAELSTDIILQHALNLSLRIIVTQEKLGCVQHFFACRAQIGWSSRGNLKHIISNYFSISDTMQVLIFKTRDFNW